MNEDVAYVRSKSGAWHVLTAETHGHALTACGLALRDGLVDTHPPTGAAAVLCARCDVLDPRLASAWVRR